MVSPMTSGSRFSVRTVTETAPERRSDQQGIAYVQFLKKCFEITGVRVRHGIGIRPAKSPQVVSKHAIRLREFFHLAIPQGGIKTESVQEHQWCTLADHLIIQRGALDFYSAAFNGGNQYSPYL